MLPHGLEMTGDRAVDQRARLVDRVSGRNTPRKVGNVGRHPPFALLVHHQYFSSGNPKLVDCDFVVAAADFCDHFVGWIVEA